MTTHWSEALVRLSACEDAVEWAREQASYEEAWRTCARGDWMLWLAGRCAGPVGDERRKPLALAAAAGARLALPVWETRHPHLDDCPRVCIETVEAWARGDATIEEVCVARAAAYAAAAYAAAYVAGAAAAGAAAAAYAAVAVAASWAGAAAAATADAFAAAGAGARAETLLACADIVREHYPEPPSTEGKP